jgi:hypothetical protein
MNNWRDGANERLFRSNHNKDDVVTSTDDIEAVTVKGIKTTLAKWMKMKVRMSGGVVFSRVKDSGKYDEYAILPSDFRSLSFDK